LDACSGTYELPPKRYHALAAVAKTSPWHATCAAGSGGVQPRSPAATRGLPVPNTADEVAVIAAELRERGGQSVIVVTSKPPQGPRDVRSPVGDRPSATQPKSRSRRRA